MTGREKVIGGRIHCPQSEIHLTADRKKMIAGRIKMILGGRVQSSRRN
jgi:hypothetical protein